MRFWIGVASRDHVMQGVEGGFCQLEHGKAAPVKQLSPGDWIAYYSPRSQTKDGEPVQAFTAIGRVKPGKPYQGQMADGFYPIRGDVEYFPAQEVAIRPMLDDLEFITDKAKWGVVFRRGSFEVQRLDFERIAQAMGVEIDPR